MIKERMLKAINEQITAEHYSAYLYLSMSAYFESLNLKGFANWMYVQYQEEMTHVMKFFYYIIDRGGKVVLDTIQKPPCEWSSPEKVFEEALKHEEYVTGLINRLVDISIEEKDHATNNLLQWYVAEQVEEEANASEVLEKVRMVKGSSDGLYVLDKELATRVFVDQTQASKA